MIRAELIEAEARKRASMGGHDPDMPADRLSSFSEEIPLWRVYARRIEAEIAGLEAAGFIVIAAPPDYPAWRTWLEGAAYCGVLALLILGLR